MKNELDAALRSLSNGEVIIYPTDTIWGLGGDATNVKVVRRIFELKHRSRAKSLVVLMRDVDMLNMYIKDVPKEILTLLDKTDYPTTIIYQNPQGLAGNAIALDNTVAIRIPQHDFCQKLLSQFGKPIVSTSANMSGRSTPKSFDEIDEVILDGADYVVNLERSKQCEKASRILKININGELEIIRS